VVGGLCPREGIFDGKASQNFKKLEGVSAESRGTPDAKMPGEGAKSIIC
jgi:hypothetical protein